MSKRAETRSFSSFLFEQEEAGPFQCPFCELEPFDTREELDAHLKKVHSKTMEEYIGRLRQDEFQQQQMNTRRRGAIIRLRRKRMRKLGKRL